MRFYESLDLCTGLFRWDHRHLACAKVVQDSDSCKYDFGFSAHILARSILGANRKSIECANSLHPGFDVSKIDCLSQELDFVRLPTDLRIVGFAHAAILATASGKGALHKTE